MTHPLASVAREGGYRLVVLRCDGGDVLLRMVDASGRESKRWYMRLRPHELPAVIDALMRATTR